MRRSRRRVRTLATTCQDNKGNRYCANLVSVAGLPMVAAKDEAAKDEA